MPAAVVAAVALCAFALAYRFYGRFLAHSVFQSEGEDCDEFVTPAHELNDGVDYVPTKSSMLFGHHFTSIAGAGPIVGPAVAVIWGWLPAVLWVCFGSIFIGAVHDFGCLVVSVKSKGRSLADLSGVEVSNRVRILFLLLILFLTWIVLAVFAFVCASLFVDYPASVLPVNFEIIVAMVLGYLVYKKNVKVLIPSIAALILLYVMVFAGVNNQFVSYKYFLNPASEAELVGLLADQHAEAAKNSEVKAVDVRAVKSVLKWLKRDHPEQSALAQDIFNARKRAVTWWMYGLLAYAFVASVLPVWLLLQPRDYINSHQLMVGLGGLYLGLMILNPPIVAPAFEAHPAGAPDFFPFIFVVIACGAVSGFHGLVSSGTSSKQLDKLTDARPVAYKAMIGEAILALIVVMSCVAGFKDASTWQAHYASWSNAQSLDAKLNAFLHGGSWFLSQLGLPINVGLAVIAVIVISFAATTLDSAARVQRFVLAELGEGLGPLSKLFSNAYIGSFIACASPLLLLTASGQTGRPLWLDIWPIFGASNQLLGALALAVLTLWLWRRKRPVLYTAIPFLFISVITCYAFVLKLWPLWTNYIAGKPTNLVLLVVTSILFLFGLWIFVEAMVGILTLLRIGNDRTVIPEPEVPSQADVSNST